MLVLAALGFAGGLPNMLVNSVAPVWASDVGWQVSIIGFLAFLQLPYALKFLWAPVVDRVQLPWSRALGRRRAWLVLAQGCVACAVLGIALCGANEASILSIGWRNVVFMGLLAVMVLFSATQDIVADAYRTEVLQERQFGMGAGVFVSGYRIAYVVVGSAVLLLADKIGWQLSVGALAAVALAGCVIPLVAREPERELVQEPGLRSAVVEPVAELWRAWGLRVLVLAAFVLLFRLPDQLCNAMTAPLLVKGLGYTPSDIAWVRQGLGFTLTIAGALAGGWMVARIGIVGCLWIFGVLQALSNAGFMVLAQVFDASTHQQAAAGTASIYALVPVIAVESFAGGLVSAGFVAFLMSVCSIRNVATQYAMLTALMVASGASGGGLSGLLAQHVGFTTFFAVTVAAGVAGMALIPLLRRSDRSDRSDLRDRRDGTVDAKETRAPAD